VDSSDILVATPNSYNSTPKSGTWYTIHYATSKNVPTYVIYPNGRTQL
jgi:nucleoside 2-deoxyribosyltransferase